LQRNIEKLSILCQEPSDWRTGEHTGWFIEISDGVARFVPRRMLNPGHTVNVPCARYFCEATEAKIASMNFMTLKSET
jgi:hypothetical protein